MKPANLIQYMNHICVTGATCAHFVHNTFYALPNCAQYIPILEKYCDEYNKRKKDKGKINLPGLSDFLHAMHNTLIWAEFNKRYSI